MWLSSADTFLWQDRSWRRHKKIDVVVVYKIDRLTRSLFDFSKIVEIFDAGVVGQNSRTILQKPFDFHRKGSIGSAMKGANR